MSISERERRDLFNGFEQTHGEIFANTIMELLPSQPADQLVTRTDMHAFGDQLRSELRGEMAELRGEMAELRAEVTTKLAHAHTATQRLIIAGMIGNAIAVISALAV